MDEPTLTEGKYSIADVDEATAAQQVHLLEDGEVLLDCDRGKGKRQRKRTRRVFERLPCEYSSFGLMPATPKALVEPSCPVNAAD